MPKASFLYTYYYYYYTYLLNPNYFINHIVLKALFLPSSLSQKFYKFDTLLVTLVIGIIKVSGRKLNCVFCTLFMYPVYLFGIHPVSRHFLFTYIVLPITVYFFSALSLSPKTLRHCICALAH